MTVQRQIIYHIIQNCEDHLTAEEIFLLAKKESPTLSIATVYRNLGLMTAAGEIRRIRVGNADRYDRNVIPHDHLICESCGRMADISLGELTPVLEQLSGQHILSYDLNLHYICPECAKKK